MTHANWPLRRDRFLFMLYRLPSRCGHAWLVALAAALTATALHHAILAPWTARLQENAAQARTRLRTTHARAVAGRPVAASRQTPAALPATPARILAILRRHALASGDIRYRRLREAPSGANKAANRGERIVMSLPLQGTYPGLQAALREMPALAGLTVQALSTDRRSPDQTQLAINLTLQWPRPAQQFRDTTRGMGADAQAAADLFPYQGSPRGDAAATALDQATSGAALAAPPAAPSLPFRFAGTWSAHPGADRLILLAGPRSIILCARCRGGNSIGAVIERVYRIESIDAKKIVFTYLPLDIRQTLSLD